MKISEHIKTILSVAVILTIHFIPLSAQGKEKYPAEVQVKLHGLTAVASLDSGFRSGAKPRTESHSSTPLQAWLSENNIIATM